MAERSVIVHRSFDPVQTEMIGDVMREGGLSARVIGTRSGAAIGVGQVIMSVHIEVPESQAAQATDFLEAFFAGDGAELLHAEGELDAEGVAEVRPADEPPRPILAFGVALLLPIGAGHLYARLPWTAGAIFVGQLSAFGSVLYGDAPTALIFAGVMAGVLAVADLVGGLLAVGSYRRGVRRSKNHQLVVGAALLVVAFTAGRLASALAVDRAAADPFEPYGRAGDGLARASSS